MVRVNDLVAAFSGQAHLGVEGPEFLLTSLLPFGHLHCLSGVWHDPQYGTSGVVRFDAECGRFQASMDGGISFQTIPTEPVTLNKLYEMGNSIFIDANQLTTLTIDRQFILSTLSDMAPITISGMQSLPKESPNEGDLYMVRHGISSGTIPTDLQNNDAVRAKSLGVGQLVLNTGSGLTDISIGSGFYFIGLDPNIVLSLTTSTPSSGILIPFTDIIYNDLNYGSGIRHTENNLHTAFRVFSPGLYECFYGVNWEKDSGGNPVEIKVQARRNYHEILSASVSYCFIRNSTSTPFGTTATTFLFEAEAGDIISLNVTPIGLMSGETAAILNDSSAAVGVRKVSGSRRHENKVEDF